MDGQDRAVGVEGRVHVYNEVGAEEEEVRGV